MRTVKRAESICTVLIYQLFHVNIFILQERHIEVVELLLRTPGIDVNAANIWGYTPLHWAVEVSDKPNKHI